MTATRYFISMLLLFQAACSVPASAAERLAASTLDPPKLAYLDDGKLYYFQVKDRWKLLRDSLPIPDEFWQVKMTLEGSCKKRKQFICDRWIAGDRRPDRWRIRDGYFWWVIDHKSQGGQDRNEGDVWRLPLEKVRSNADTIRGSIMESSAKYCCTLEPMIVWRERLANDTPSDAIPDNAYFDVIPDTKDAIHLILACRGEIIVWRGVWSWCDREKKDRNPTNSKKMPYIKWDNEIPPKEEELWHDARPVLRVRTNMREGFFAYQSKTHFFFVTISGKLYACRKRGEKQRTELLWNDANNPIRVIIHASDAHKTFAFTRVNGYGQKPGRDVFFELSPKLKPIEYDPKMIAAWNPADPLQNMMEYARVLFWKVPPSDWSAPSRKMSPQQWQLCWEDLRSAETSKVHRAVWHLRARGAETVAFLKDRLRPVPEKTQEVLDRLLADLDSEHFDRREASTRELSRGVVAESLLRKRLADSPSLEQRRRLHAILEELPEWPTKNPELLRQVYALRVLQQIGTPEAKALLEKVAAGAPSARLTQKAKDALQSLERRKKR